MLFLKLPLLERSQERTLVYNININIDMHIDITLRYKRAEASCRTKTNEFYY